jgi:heme A synthase
MHPSSAEMKALLRHPVTRLILIAVTAGLAFLAGRTGNPVLMALGAAALAAVCAWFLLTRARTRQRNGEQDKDTA